MNESDWTTKPWLKDPSPPPPPPPQLLSQAHFAPRPQSQQQQQQQRGQPFAGVGAAPSAADKSLEEVQREVREMMEQGKREATRTHESAPDARSYQRQGGKGGGWTSIHSFIRDFFFHGVPGTQLIHCSFIHSFVTFFFMEYPVHN